MNGEIRNGDFFPGPSINEWYGGAGDPVVKVPLNRDVVWIGGQGEHGKVAAIHDESFTLRYGYVLGWQMKGRPSGETSGGTAYRILVDSGVQRPTHQEVYDLCAAEGGFGPMTLADYERLVGRPDAGGSEPGSSQANPIWLTKATDPRVSPARVHAETWQVNGVWYGLDDKTRGVGLIPTPLGGDTSGGAGVPADTVPSVQVVADLRTKLAIANSRAESTEAVLEGVYKDAAKLSKAKPTTAGKPLRDWAAKVDTWLRGLAE